MQSGIAAKFDFVLKAMSMSRTQLARELGVDRSAVGRWLAGAVEPTAQNLSAFTRLVARQVEGFTILDWERDLAGLAAVLRVEERKEPTPALVSPLNVGAGLPLPLLEECALTAQIRGRAYEGFYRSTRPYGQAPGVFVHDLVMLRMEPNGLLSLTMSSSGVEVRGWALTLQNQLFCMAAEMTSGAYVFAIVNGVSTLKAGLLDGLILSCALDIGRTPMASRAVFERIADLTGEAQLDTRRFQELSLGDGPAPEGSVPEALQRHLVADVGPSHVAEGGDWLLRLPLWQSMSRGLSIWK